jgi:hypothetical protein
VQEVRKKLSIWYGSSSTSFPDGTKMRLVPTFNSVLSTANKLKFASCLARQAALSAGLASGNTWEMATNLLLDAKDPNSKKSFRQVMMSIHPLASPDISLFHTIDRQWRSENVVTFTFRPEHEPEACSFIAGLIPFLRDKGHLYFLKMFSPDAQQRHASSTWNSSTRQVTSIEEEELGEFLSADDNLNLSDEPTHERLPVSGPETDNDQVAFDIPEFTPANFPEMNNDTDSLSTFHPKKSDSQCNLDKVSDETTIRHDSDSISKMSDTAATISTLKSSVTDLNHSFQTSFNDQGEAIQRLLDFLSGNNSTMSSYQSEAANNPQTQLAGDSLGGVTGHC